MLWLSILSAKCNEERHCRFQEDYVAVRYFRCTVGQIHRLYHRHFVYFLSRLVYVPLMIKIFL